MYITIWYYMYLKEYIYISMYYPPFNTRSGHKSLGQREICLGFKIKKVGDTSLGALLTFFPFQSSSMMHTSRPITLRILNGSICEHISCPNINVPCHKLQAIIVITASSTRVAFRMPYTRLWHFVLFTHLVSSHLISPTSIINQVR